MLKQFNNILLYTCRIKWPLITASKYSDWIDKKNQRNVLINEVSLITYMSRRKKGGTVIIRDSLSLPFEQPQQQQQLYLVSHGWFMTVRNLPEVRHCAAVKPNTWFQPSNTYNIFRDICDLE